MNFLNFKGFLKICGMPIHMIQSEVVTSIITYG
jgi:hypothetical protein